MSSQYDPAPSYYEGPNGVECWDAIDALGLSSDYYLASAFAYLWRTGRKPGAEISSDIRKAHNYLGRWLANAETASFGGDPVELPVSEYDSTTESLNQLANLQATADQLGNKRWTGAQVTVTEPTPPTEISLLDRLKASLKAAGKTFNGDIAS